jgi:hypothetical protein
LYGYLKDESELEKDELFFKNEGLFFKKTMPLAKGAYGDSQKGNDPRAKRR